MFDPLGFISSQLEVWPEARERHHALESSVMERTVDIGTRRIRLQHNPARAISTGARVDAASIAARPCFLCSCNRPAEQLSHRAGDYEILVNPYPIFPNHLTIPTIDHTPQRIAGRIDDMLALTQMLDGFTVFYNGPQCGASAPDHCHFQAAPTRCFPLWDSLPCSGETIDAIDITPAVITITHANAQQAAMLAEQTIDALPMQPDAVEPMVNILACNSNGLYRIVIIPRRAHRPANFSTDGYGVMISPASIDMAGVIVTPLKSDFERLQASDIIDIYQQVGYDQASIKPLI